jgi:GT2 family glycosyltransferase
MSFPEITFLTLSRSVEPVCRSRTEKGTEVHAIVGPGRGYFAHGMNARVADFEVEGWMVLIHDDASLRESPAELLQKLTFLQSIDPKVGVVGCVGCKRITIDGRWWIDDDRFGQIVQGYGDEPNLVFRKVSVAERADSVDGCFMCIRREVWDELGGMDERYKGWHFYDADLCVSAMRAGFNNYVMDCVVSHLSAGQLDEDWHRSRDIFAAKWKGILPGELIN